MFEWSIIISILTAQLTDLVQTNWQLVHFRRGSLVLTVAGCGLVVALIALMIRHYRQSQSFYSGSGFKFNKNEKAGLFNAWLRALPIILLWGALLFQGIVAADPFTVVSDNSDVVKSRLVIYVVDASTSMGWRFRNYNQSRSEIVKDFMLNLLEKRRPQRDLVGLVRFETSADVISDFTDSVDSQKYFLYSMPSVVTYPNAYLDFPGRWVVKHDVIYVSFEHGSTRLDRGLEAAYYLFDVTGNKSIKDRSAVIVTDGAADKDPEEAFKQLYKRHIIPYLIFIDPDIELEKQLHGLQGITELKLKLTDKLKEQVQRYGGQFFAATDKSSLQRISDKLQLLQPTITEVKHSTREIPFYQRFQAASLACLCLAGLLRLLLIVFQRTV